MFECDCHFRGGGLINEGAGHFKNTSNEYLHFFCMLNSEGLFSQFREFRVGVDGAVFGLRLRVGFCFVFLEDSRH